MEKFRETIKKIRQDLLSTVVCRPTLDDNCWYIKGTWYDSERREHETIIYTHNRHLATGWQEDRDNIDLYYSYLEDWAQVLMEYIIHNYEI